MDSVLNFFNLPAVTVFGNSLTTLEVFGFITGIVGVLLTVYKNIWNFPIGILNSALLSILFFNSRLFADAGLQIVFITLGLMGWWQWLQAKHKGQLESTQALKVKNLTRQQQVIGLGILLIVVFALYQLLIYIKGDVPFFDALITALSIAAQILLNRRYLENWWIWIAVDVISIPVYFYKGLYLIALLYVVFLALAIMGLTTWKKAKELRA